MKTFLHSVTVCCLLWANSASIFADGTFNINDGTNTGTGFTWNSQTQTLTITANGTYTINGTGEATTNRIVVSAGGTKNITLDGVNIDVSGTNNACAFNMSGATVNLTITGDNFLTSGGGAGLELTSNATLIIGGTGSLEATGGGFGNAGIGSCTLGRSGSITISSGTVTATGAADAAGIGGGAASITGSITISGGIVTATGSNGGAGIGGGGNGGNGGNITISGGTVTATGGNGSTGIGGGSPAGNAGSITISGGTVTATGNNGGVGIGGGGGGGNGGSITISGGTVTATGNNGGEGIGGSGGGGGSIVISGGTVTATGNNGGEGIGGSIVITGGSVKASSIQSQPTDGNQNDVYLNTLTAGNPAVANTAVIAGSINNVPCAQTADAVNSIYGIRDVVTDEYGKVYFYLPVSVGAEPVTLTANGTEYSESYTRTADDGNAEILKPHGIALSETGTYDFSAAIYGYAAAPQAVTVTVTNAGNQATGALAVQLAGTNAASFTLSGSTSISDIPVSGNTTFTVAPNAGLAAGTYTATVTVSGANVATQSFEVGFTVNRKEVTVTWDNLGYTYNGAPQCPAASVTAADGLVAGDVLTVTVTGGQTGAGGPYTATATALDGTDRDNYTLPATLPTKAFTIAKKPVTVTGGAIAPKTYDGANGATVTGLTFSGLVTGESLANADYSVSASFDNPNAGSGKTVTVTVTLQGTAKAGNYTLTNGNLYSLTGQSIAPASAGVVWSNTSLAYSGAAQVPSASINGVGSDGDIPLTVTGGQTDVGSYTARALAPNANYTLTGDETVFAITPKQQTITFTPSAVLSLEDGTYTLAASTEDGVTVKFRIDGSDAAASIDAGDNALLRLMQPGSVTVTAYIDDTNYGAEAVLRTLTVESGSAGVMSVTVSNTVQTGDIYLADCGAASVEISVTPEESGAQVIYGGTVAAGNTFTVDLPRADIYRITYTVQSGSGAEQDYTLQVERRFAFADIVGTKFNNVLFVSNNPSNNGGYSFTDYQWFKDGQSIGGGQYYSAGSARSGLLDAAAAYTLTLTTQEGKTLHVCPGSVSLRATSLRVYPNPARPGEAVRLESPAPDNSIVRIYDLHGRLVGTEQLNGGAARIHLPQTTGIYLITVGNETTKVAVTE
jgi:hypothetical protein